MRRQARTTTRRGEVGGTHASIHPTTANYNIAATINRNSRSRIYTTAANSCALVGALRRGRYLYCCIIVERNIQGFLYGKRSRARAITSRLDGYVQATTGSLCCCGLLYISTWFVFLVCYRAVNPCTRAPALMLQAARKGSSFLCGGDVKVKIRTNMYLLRDKTVYRGTS